MVFADDVLSTRGTGDIGHGQSTATSVPLTPKTAPFQSRYGRCAVTFSFSSCSILLAAKARGLDSAGVVVKK